MTSLHNLRFVAIPLTLLACTAPCNAGIVRSGLVLHLDAGALKPPQTRDETNLGAWPDESGHGHDLEQSDAARRPVLVTGGFHGLPVVRYDGNAYLDGPPVLAEGDTSFTMAAVWRRTGVRGAEVICEQASPGAGRRASLLTINGRYGFNGQNNDQHDLLPYHSGKMTLSIMTVEETGVVRLWHNDEVTSAGRKGWINPKIQHTGTALFRMGAKAATGGECLHGDIGEILVYDRVLSFSEIKELNEWLAKKWGIGRRDSKGRRSIVTMTIGKMDEGPDRTSRVPTFHFAATLAEQEAQLEDNPVLKRFAESRRRLAGDPWRPLYHFVSPESTMNDPNGLCFWQDRWHLFYQAFPPEDTRQHWGHAVSDDLIHWRDLPYAIYPNPEERCFSGTTLVEDDRVIAIYHGVKAGTMIATSRDPLLLNWKKVTGRAVIPHAKPGDKPLPYNIFDPCLWKKGGLYYALTAGTLPEGPGGKRVRAWFLHRSADLANWEYLHPFAENDDYGLVGDDGACPYFWPLGDKHLLLHFSHMSGGKYLLGDYDTQRDKFVVTGGGDFNFGPATPSGVHAPSACPDGKGNVIVIFNMNPGMPTEGWNQIMSLPRRLRLVGRDELAVEPAGDIASLRADHRHVGSTPLPANREVVLDDIAGKSLELLAEIDTKDAPVVEMRVLRSPNREEYTRLVFYRDRGYARAPRSLPTRHGAFDSLLSVDTSRSSTLPDAHPRAPETAPVYLRANEPLRLHVFIDQSILEVFANGRQCVGVRVYPGRHDSVGVSVRAQGRDAVLTSLDAWRMRTIYASDGA